MGDGHPQCLAHRLGRGRAQNWHAHTHTCMHDAHTHTCMHDAHTHTHACMMHTPPAWSRPRSVLAPADYRVATTAVTAGVGMCMCRYVHVRAYREIHMHTCRCTHMRICTCLPDGRVCLARSVSRYPCTYVRAHAYGHVHVYLLVEYALLGEGGEGGGAWNAACHTEARIPAGE